MLLDYQELTGLESAPGFSYNGTEDCLFLSVYAPQDKTNLPVFVWIRKLDHFASCRIHTSSLKDTYSTCGFVGPSITDQKQMEGVTVRVKETTTYP